MTPAKEYAQKRAEAVALIEKHAPERLQAQLIELLRPAIALKANRCADEEIPLGASKFGGAPHVPAGFEWPTWNEKPLGFLAQINLEAVAPFDIEGLLPKSGLLSFFYYFGEEEDWPFGEPEDQDGSRILQFSFPVEKADVPEDLVAAPINTASIGFEVFWSLPSWLQGEKRQNWSQQEKDEWGILTKTLKANSPHWMGGYPVQIQSDARDDAASFSGRGMLHDWHLLLQVDSDDEIDFMWGDAGAMFYLIHQDELKQKDFSKTWIVAQCS